jgi:MFS family permease
MTNHTSQLRSPTLWKLILFGGIASFCALLPADAVPALAQLFHINSDTAEGVLSWFLFGYGIGPIIYGPIANRFGRKKSLLIGLFLGIIGMGLSLLSLAIHSFELMLIGRLIAGIGTSAGLVISMVMLNETNDPTEARRKYSIVILFFAFAPSLALAIGGILTEHIGASSVFIIMPAILIAIIATAASIKETYQGESIPIKILPIARNFAQAFSCRTFILLTLILGAASSAMYVFNGLSPLIAINTLHISPETYGELSLIAGLGLFCGALLSARLANIFSAKQNIAIALTYTLLGALIMMIAFMLNYINLYTLLIPAFLIFFGIAIIVPNSSMSALAASDNPAIAASAMNSTALLLSSIILSISGYFFTISLIAVPISLCLLAIASIIFLMLTPAQQKVRASND